jgi:hypothetical protein
MQDESGWTKAGGGEDRGTDVVQAISCQFQIPSGVSITPLQSGSSVFIFNHLKGAADRECFTNFERREDLALAGM